jgi:hypothetical protein
MKTNRTIWVLTAINVVLVVSVMLREGHPVQADGVQSVLRGQKLEIVDARGNVRASIQVIPEGPARREDGSVTEDGGKIFPEAVVLRLIRPDGRPSVKIATTEQGSGLDLSGGTDPTYLVLSAQGGETSVSLTNKNGKQQVVKP